MHKCDICKDVLTSKNIIIRYGSVRRRCKSCNNKIQREDQRRKAKIIKEHKWI